MGGKRQTYEDGGFPKDSGITEVSLLDLMVVRAGDLEIDLSDMKWWEMVKSHLLQKGINVNEIYKIIRERCGLTADNKRSGDRRYPQKDYEEINDMLNQINGLKPKIQYYEDGQKKIREFKSEKERLRSKRDKLWKAFNFKKYKDAKKAYGDWMTYEKEIRGYGVYTYEDKSAWEEEEKKMDGYKKEVELCVKSREEEEGARDSLRKKLEALKIKREEASHKWVTLKNLKMEEKLKGLGHIPPKEPFFFVILVIFSVAFGGISIPLGIAFSKNSLILIGALFLFLGSIFYLFYYVLRKKRRDYERNEREIVNIFRELNPESTIETSDEVLRNYYEYERLAKEENEIKEVQSELTTKDENIITLAKRQRKIEEDIEVGSKSIERIKSKTGVKDLNELADKLEKKKDLSRAIERCEELLTGYLGGNSEAWGESIEKMKIVDPGIEWNKGEYERLERLILSKDKELRELEDEINNIKGEFLYDLGKKAEIILQKEFDFQNLYQIYKIEELLEKERAELDWLYEAGRLAISKLKEASRDLESNLEKIFSGKGDNISSYFKEMTGNRYINVEMIEEGKGKNIHVYSDDSKWFPLEELSTGTQDQLYLAFRLTLLNEIFNEKGFLILDDAFLTSDSDRRKNLLKLTKRLSQGGWQILYFALDEGNFKELFSLHGISTRTI